MKQPRSGIGFQVHSSQVTSSRPAGPAATALADAYAIGKILYPAQFEDVELASKADEIYTFLVGKPIYKRMEKDYGPIGEVAPLCR